MHIPVWVTPAHPITSRELDFWSNHRRVLWITFVILPLLVSACMWAAMLSPRPYRKARPRDEARQERVKGAGNQFDPALVDEFLLLPG